MADETRPNETPEERRKRRIEEARAKLKSQNAAEGTPSESTPSTPTESAAATPPAASGEETVEERRARRIAEAREKLKSQQAQGEAAAAPPAAASGEETVEERRARRIAEAREKLKSQQAEGAPAAAPPAAASGEETVEERRARRIAEARAKVKGTGAPAEAAAQPVAQAPAAPAVKKPKGGAETSDVGDDPLIRALRERFGDSIVSAIAMVGQRIVVVTKDSSTEVLEFLRDDPVAGFDLLLDVTAVHRPEEERQFEIVYQLVSTTTCARLRVKALLVDGESIRTATALWPTANWLERECYDMFGIVFDGHPDLRRILLPEDWEGHPLRKEYPVEFRENRWVREHLNIVEIPADADFTGKFEA